MNHRLVQIRYQLTFLSPFHAGTGLRRGLIHRTVARSSDGFLLVPGSTVKGVVREQCEVIARLLGLHVREPHQAGAAIEHFDPRRNLVELIFGSRSQPGTLGFDDAQLVIEQQTFFRPDGSVPMRFLDDQVESRGRVQLSRTTRAALPGHFFVTEYGIKGLSFEGSITGTLPALPCTSKGSSYALSLLAAGLLATERLGSNRSSGAGHCTLSVQHIKLDREPVSLEGLIEGLDELEYYALEEGCI